MGGFGLGLGFLSGSQAPQKNPGTPYTPRKRSAPRKRSRRRPSSRRRRRSSRRGSRRRTSGRRRSGTRSPRRRSSRAIFAVGSGDSVVILKMFWWLVHGVIATMIIHLETTKAHNYVAALLIMPEFSLDRVGISYIFNGGNRRNSFSTAVFFGYSFLVAIFMVMFGCIIQGLRMLAESHDVDDLALIAGIAAVMSTIVIGPVEMVNFVSQSVGWAVLLGLSTYYVHLGLTFLPALYVLIMAVSAVDYYFFHMEYAGSKDTPVFLI